MPVPSLAAWTIQPNWQQPVIERLSWKSAVLVSPSAAEQRFALRWSPRRSFEAMFSVNGRTRTLLDVALSAAGAADWFLPIWHDGERVSSAISSGASSLSVDTDFREFRVNGFVMLWASETDYEVHEVTSIGSGTIGIDPVTSKTWPAWTRVFPCVRARIGAFPEQARRSGAVSEGSIRFDVTTDNDWSDGAASIGLPTYQTLRVLTQRPDRVNDLTVAYERILEDLDGEVGLITRQDRSGLSLPTYGHAWMRLGRQEQANLRALFYDLKGRVTPLWVPTFQDDLELAVGTTALDDSLLVEPCGLVRFGVPFSGREHLHIRLRDGTDIFRRITGVSTNAGNEEVVLDSALGVAFEPRDVLSISFMSLCRLNTDDIEINHITGEGGVAQISTTFRRTPETRNVSDIGVPLIGDTVKNDIECGVVGCAAYDIGMGWGEDTGDVRAMNPASNDSGSVWFGDNGVGDSFYNHGALLTNSTDVWFGYSVTAVPVVNGVTITVTRTSPTSSLAAVPFCAILSGPVLQAIDCSALNTAAQFEMDVAIEVTGTADARVAFCSLYFQSADNPEDFTDDDVTPSTLGYTEGFRSVVEYVSGVQTRYESTGFPAATGPALDDGTDFTDVATSITMPGATAAAAQFGVFHDTDGTLTVTITITNCRHRCLCT